MTTIMTADQRTRLGLAYEAALEAGSVDVLRAVTDAMAGTITPEAALGLVDTITLRGQSVREITIRVCDLVELLVALVPGSGITVGLAIAEAAASMARPDRLDRPARMAVGDAAVTLRLAVEQESVERTAVAR